MKQYPSIEGPLKAPREQCIAFYKYDGSNLRFEYNRKRGFYKFGTRKRLFDSNDEVFGGAIELFQDTMAKPIIEATKDFDRNADQYIVYCEFFGPNSFAGNHDPSDAQQLVLLDVSLHRKGFVSPIDFKRAYCNPMGSKAAAIIYEGLLDQEFIDKVRANEYDLDEGVVCKGGKGHGLWMCKIKTMSYYKKLKEQKGEQWHEYWE